MYNQQVFNVKQNVCWAAPVLLSSGTVMDISFTASLQLGGGLWGTSSAYVCNAATLAPPCRHAS
jgi:hypothetical protein